MTTRPATRDDEPSRRGVFAISLAIHVILLGVFPFLIANFRGEPEPDPIDIVFYPRDVQPREMPEIVPEPEPVVERTPEQPPIVAEAERPPSPKKRVEPRRPEPRVESAPLVASLEPSAVRLPDPEPPRPAPKPERRRPPVQTNVFQASRSEPAPKQSARAVTRDAGFAADAEPVRSAPRKQLRASPRVGGFEVDPTPSSDDAPAVTDRKVVTTSGFGSDDAPESSKHAPRQRTTVQTAGFTGDVAETPARRTGGGGAAAVSTGGFGADEPAARPRAVRKKPAENPDTPVEIMSKPKPVYTAEARELKVEGEVVLDVVFVADGEMRIVGVVEGLGHGLDEAAIAAARKIEFKPARRNGQPVDHSARLRIVFQLA